MLRTLPQLNDTQSVVIERVIDGRNVIVDSCAGAGKSTVGYHIASEMQMRNKRCLLMVYNANMKDETRQNVERCGLNNLTVHTYHSACKSFYGMEGFDDSSLRRVLKAGTEFTKKIAFEVFILDELQDMTKEYYHLVRNIMRDNVVADPQIICLGDKHQAVNEFKGSDSRYLTMADQLYNDITTRQWRRVDLDVTERVPSRIVDFINRDFLSQPRMRAARKGGEVVYLKVNPFKANTYVDLLKEAIDRYTAEEVLILAPSLKSPQCPAKVLENELVTKHHVACDMPSRDDEEKPAEVLKGKVAFQTFHSCKGTTRKVVIVFGIDGTYHDFFASDPAVSRCVCPNPVYVALSRASKRLVLIVDGNKDPFPTMDTKSLHKRVKIIDRMLDAPKPKRVIEDTVRVKTDVSSLVRYLSNDTLATAMEQLKIDILQTPCEAVPMSSTVSSTGYTETVSDINGNTIPALFEIESKGTCSMLTFLHGQRLRGAAKTFVNRCREDVSKGSPLELAEVSRLGVLYYSERNGVKSRLRFLQKFDWLQAEHAEACLQRMRSVMSKECRCEVSLRTTFGDTLINGQADVIDDCNRVLYEIKCKADLADEDVLQLAIYAFMHDQEGFEYKLFNIRTGELRQMTADRAELKQMIKVLIEASPASSVSFSNEEFLQKIQEL